MASGADIIVGKNGKQYGPFTVEQVRGFVERGDLEVTDFGSRLNQEGTFRLRDLLEEARPAGPTDETEVFLPRTMPMVENPRPKPEEKPKRDRNRVVYHGHPHPLNYATLVFLSGLGILLGFAFWGQTGFVLFGGLVFTLFTYFYISFQRSICDYLISRDRVEIFYGFVTKSSHEVRIRDVKTINVRTRGIKGWLGVGDLEISSSGSSGIEVEFAGVWKPHRLKELIRAVQDGKI